MKPADFDAFWSYAHVDDERQGGAIRQLATRLRDEVGLLTGDELNIFVDRKDLQWGEVWREKIDSAIGDVPFLIAIVTPSFIKSAECRREVLTFVGQAASRGQERLLLPIVYTKMPDLKEDSDDELVALLARLQWESWADLRLEDPNGPKFMQALNRLAERIQDLRLQAEAARDEDELTSEPEKGESLEEVVQEIDSRLYEWLDAVEGDQVKAAEWTTICEARLGKIPRLRRMRANPGAILSVYVRMGRDLQPIARQRLAWAKSYARITIELDPFVRAAIRLVERLPQFVSLLAPLREGVREAMIAISGHKGKMVSYFPIQDLKEYSSHLEAASDLYDQSLSFVDEGNAVVRQWETLLSGLDQRLREERSERDLRRSLSSQTPRRPARTRPAEFGVDESEGFRTI